MSTSSSIKRVVGPTIQTVGGTYFDFESPETSVICLRDIAHALANICRFTGHTQRFYSVAEHSVLCSYLVWPEHKRAALMHDAAEAYCGDVSSPLKSLLPGYKTIEKRVEAAIFARFSIPVPLPESVKVADRRMLRLEQRFAMNSKDEWGELDYGEDLPNIKLEFWTPARATIEFMARAQELGVRSIANAQAGAST